MQFGSLFVIPFGYASLIWPVSGVMLGLYLVNGPWILFSTFLGTLLYLFSSEGINSLPVYANLLLAAITVLQMILSKELIEKFCSLPIRSHSPWQIIKFLILTGPIASAVSTPLSMFFLAPYLNYSNEILWYIALSLWTGNTVSIIFITPVILFLSSNKYVRRAQRPFAATFATVFVLTAITSVYLLQNRNHEQEQNRIFIKATQEYIKATGVIVNSLKHNLTALDGLIQASEYISKSEFEQFTSEMLALHTNEAIRAFAWLPRITTEQREEFEQHLVSEQEPNLKIRQLTSSGVIVAPEQDYYLPIKYSVPYDKNKQAISLDVSRHPTVQQSVTKAIEQQDFVLSPMVSLIQQRDKYTGVIVYYPSFSDKAGEHPLTGLTEVVLELDLLLQSLHQQPQGEFYTFQLAYGDNNTFTHQEFNHKAKFSHEVEFELFDKKAQLLFVSTELFEQRLVNWNSFAIIFTGVIIGVVCVMFVFFIVTFNASLTRQVNDSTKKLVQQNAELEKAYAAKNLFLANISHEYRTPLNAIIGFTEVAQSEIKDPQSLQYFNQINQSSNVLLGIVNDVLDYSKMQAGELRLEAIPFNLKLATQSVIDILAHKARQKGIAFEFDFNSCFDIWVSADEVRFKQILINLLNNAVKFTQEGKITIFCRCKDVREGKKRFSISIKDTGIGIAQETLQDLFKPFSQAEASTNRRFGGTGLGLSIVKQLTNLMGGEILAQSELGKGSNFTVSIPFKLTEAPQNTDNLEQEVKASDYQNYSVLVVEDNKVNQLVISKHLEKLQVNFILADNGQAALDILVKESVDLILMDLQMPVMDGFTASGLIKQNKALQHIPIVILSASVGKDEKEKADALGIHDYIEKPFKQEQLIKAFNKYLIDSN